MSRIQNCFDIKIHQNMSTLSKNVKKTEKQVNIKLSGDINIANSNELKKMLQEFLTDNRKIRVSSKLK